MANLSYAEIKRKIVFDALDKFPNTSNLGVARIIYKEGNLFFKDLDNARTMVRFYRGSMGKEHRETITIKKYLKNEVQPT